MTNIIVIMRALGWCFFALLTMSVVLFPFVALIKETFWPSGASPVDVFMGLLILFPLSWMIALGTGNVARLCLICPPQEKKGQAR